MSSEISFDESRRLTGGNVYFDATGAALETVGPSCLDPGALAGWRERIGKLRDALGWPQAAIVVRPHANGASLAFAAPADQLYTAATAGEWAWLASLHGLSRSGTGDRWHAPGQPAAWDEASALQTLGAMALEEANPALLGLLDAARLLGVPAHFDDDALSLGEGVHCQAWPVRDLPAPDTVAWAERRGIPKAIVTGSNGKTTTVRLMAAMARARGWRTGYSSTDGLFVDADRIDSGDYSGPMGARTVLREPTVEAAILETARGGLLRRGIAIRDARVAVVTNISPDHFGEYGVHGLEDLADVKLSVVRALARDGTLVLNADDALLLQRGPTFAVPLAWFALDHDHPQLQAMRASGGATCGVRDGQLLLWDGMHLHDLGAIAAMPVTLAGSARYNVANVAAAALGAWRLGVAAADVADVLARFGSQPGDNPGRLQRWQFGNLQVFLDYAHNPEGLAGLLQVAEPSRGTGRFGLILGQAGNREDRDIRALAAVAAGFTPDRVWLKDIGGDYLRGRTPGDIAAILHDELIERGLPASALVVCLEETRAAREALAWARDGDVLVLPIHEPEARDDIVALLDRLQVAQWRAGEPLTDDRVLDGPLG